MADIKEPSDHFEENLDKGGRQEDTAPLPDSLVNMTAQEIQKLGVKTTAKLDMLIMPPMVILYIL